MPASRAARSSWLPPTSALVAVWLVASTLTGAQLPTREIAVTFDDLPATHGGYAPMKETTDRLLDALTSAGVPAIGFVNEFKLFAAGDAEVGRRTALLRAWLDAGHDLGNHSYSHVVIGTVPFRQYADDVIKGETVTRRLLTERGKRLVFFRHPQLQTGPTEADRVQLARFLEERSYTVAPVTIDNNDFIFANAYRQARARNDVAMAARIADAYVSYMTQVIEHFEQLSRDFLGYEVKQTLLLHANALNADHFGRLALMLRARGYRFIRLGEALVDPAYTLPEAHSPRGLSWLHRWMLAKGQPMREEPREPAWIGAYAGEPSR